MGNKVMCFDLDSSSLKIKEIMNSKDFIAVEIWAISDEYPNNNISHFPYESFQKNIDNKVFFNKPILGKFNNVTNNYEVHNSQDKYDSEYDVVYKDYENGERPLGVIRESDTVRIETDENGRHWIVFTAVLWVKYNYTGVKKILKSKNSKVSVEVTVTKYHEDENGIEIFDEWIFDGVTILGFRPNTITPAKEGINNAHLTILEKMNQHTFSNQIKSIQFAYNELEETQKDIKESDSHLYIENNNEKEGIELLTYEQKREILNACLTSFKGEGDEWCWVMDLNDSVVFFMMGEIKYRAEYSIDSETKECIINYDEKVRIISDYKDFVEESEKEVDFSEEDKEENPEDKKTATESDDSSDDCDDKNHDDDKDKDSDNCGKTCEGEEGSGIEGEAFDDEDSLGSDEKDSEKCGKTCEGEEGSDSDDKVVEEKDPEEQPVEESQEDDKKDSDPDKTTDDKESDNCGKLYQIGEESLTADMLFERYTSEVERLNSENEDIKSKYDELNKNYETLMSEKNATLEKLQEFEAIEEKNRIEEFCKIINDVAKQEKFSEDETAIFIEKCKNKEYSNIEEIKKDMAYEGLKKREQEQNNNQEKNAEFSAPAEKIIAKKVMKKKSSNIFADLKAYVEN